MKNKFLLILAIVPMISSAHTGHIHNATEIILTPSAWLNHLGLVAIFGALVVLILRKTVLKYALKREVS